MKMPHREEVLLLTRTRGERQGEAGNSRRDVISRTSPGKKGRHAMKRQRGSHAFEERGGGKREEGLLISKGGRQIAIVVSKEISSIQIRYDGDIEQGEKRNKVREKEVWPGQE